MKNGWTGGQYSLFRIIFGSYLLIHFTHLIPWATETFSSEGVLPNANLSPLVKLFPNVLIFFDNPFITTTLIISASIASIFFILGYKDKISAVLMWYVLACLFGRNPLTANPSLPFIGWLLLAHCIVPKAPFGSLDAKNKDLEQLSSWQLPAQLFACCWILMSIAYGYSGIMKLFSPSWIDGSAFYEVLQNPLARPSLIRDIMLGLPTFAFKILTWSGLALELLFPLLAISKKLRPLIWFAMLMMHFGLIVLIQFADLSFGMVILQLFTFDPGWLKPSEKTKNKFIFYDGTCGLCQRWVKLVLLEHPKSDYKFSPLQGEKINEILTPEQRASLPDSVVVFNDQNKLITKSSAIISILKDLGGYWEILAIILSICPVRLRDCIYDGIASIRHKLFSKPKEMCPLLPKKLQDKFLP